MGTLGFTWFIRPNRGLSMGYSDFQIRTFVTPKQGESPEQQFCGK
jgi:hypothetical protein